MVSLILAITTAIASAGDEWSPLPLGRSNLSELRTSTPVAHGITYTRIHRGKQSERDGWTVDVAFKTNREDAWSIVKALRDSGYDSRVERVSARGYKDIEPGLLGFLVRVGKEATQTEAIALRDRLVADGYKGLRIVYTGEDGKRTTGPWLVHVLELDPGRFFGAIAPELGTEIVPGTELLTSIATRTNALAAITGGYFVIGPADGTPGDLAGISVIDGALVSEAVDGPAHAYCATESVTSRLQLKGFTGRRILNSSIASVFGAIRARSPVSRPRESCYSSQSMDASRALA